MRNLLIEEIESELKEIKRMEVGSEEHTAAINNAMKLVDKHIELEKLQLEAARDMDTYKVEMIKAEQEKKKIKIDVILTGASIAIPAALTIWGTIKTLKFEEIGSITTSAGRNFIAKLFRK